MKLSLNWLKQYVQLPKELSPSKIMYDLTMSTVEVEHITDLGQALEHVCVGQIKTITKHPDADKLRICLTDLGMHGTKSIVCGGSNLAPDQYVVVSLPGAKVRWHGQGDLVEVKETKIRGQASFGMICASEEIGLEQLFPARAANEIIDLGSLPELVSGQPLAEVIGFNDCILDIDNKSLSNRPDLWGHVGIARELAAIYDCDFILPELATLNFSQLEQLQVKISDPQLCARYIGIVIDNVINNESPFWLKSQLARVGQRPISCLVDLTNFVMLTFGQPTHVFDYKQVSGAIIEVRAAKSNEKLTLLDDSQLELDEATLVISDKNTPLALAGIMGGALSGVGDSTSKIIFESANFDSIKIRQTAAKFGVRTESSMRFEKSLDPNNAMLATALFLKTLQDIQPAAKILSAADRFVKQLPIISINICREFLTSRLGQLDYARQVNGKLSRLGFKVQEQGENFEITVPSHRATGDISIKEDIVEEIARLIGYDNLVFQPIAIKMDKAVRQPQFCLERRIRELLARQAGLNETLSYPWVNKEIARVCGSNPDNMVKLAESPGDDCETIRDTIIPSLLETVAKNLSNSPAFGLFEIGLVAFNNHVPFSAKSTHELLPEQRKNLAMAIYGASQKQVFLELKGVIENLCTALNLPLVFEENPNLQLKNQGALKVVIAGVDLGFIALPTSRVLQTCGIKRGYVAVAELNFTALKKTKLENKKYIQVSRFPTVDFDLAIVFDKKVTWNSVYSTVLACNKLIKSVKFLDQYEGEQVPDGKKSLAFSMHIVPEEKTLTAEEIAQVSNKVIKILGKELGGVLRA